MYKSDYERSITKADVRIKRQVLLKRKRRCYGRQKLLVLKLHTLLFLLCGGFKWYLLVLLPQCLTELNWMTISALKANRWANDATWWKQLGWVEAFNKGWKRSRITVQEPAHYEQHRRKTNFYFHIRVWSLCECGHIYNEVSRRTDHGEDT